MTYVDAEKEPVAVHRLASVAWFGLEAVAGNDIHHKNGIPWDNREENVEPLDHAEHTSLHRRGEA